MNRGAFIDIPAIGSDAYTSVFTSGLQFIGVDAPGVGSVITYSGTSALPFAGTLRKSNWRTKTFEARTSTLVGSVLLTTLGSVAFAAGEFVVGDHVEVQVWSQTAGAGTVNEARVQIVGDATLNSTAINFGNAGPARATFLIRNGPGDPSTASSGADIFEDAHLANNTWQDIGITGGAVQNTGSFINAAWTLNVQASASTAAGSRFYDWIVLGYSSGTY